MPALEVIRISATTTGLGRLDAWELLALLLDSSQVSERGPASGPG